MTNQPEIFQRLDVVAVPFPLATEAVRRRPALVVSEASLARDFGLYWLLMITSQAQDKQLADVLLEDWAGAGLPSPAMVRTTKIMTVPAHLIVRRLGRLGAGDAARLTLELSRFVGR